MSGPLWNLNELLLRSLEQVSPPFLLTVGRILDFDPMPYVGIVLKDTVCPFCHDPFEIQLTGQSIELDPASTGVVDIQEMG